MAVCDPQALLDDAACFFALTPGQWQVVELQLLCDLLDVQTDALAALTATDLLTYSSAALEASRVVKATPGAVASAVMFNNNGATRYLQLHNAAALPANGAVPFMVIPVPTATSVALPITFSRVPLSVGIVVALSTTAATLTIGAADGLFTVTYT